MKKIIKLEGMEEAINEAYEELMVETARYAGAAEEELASKDELERARLAGLADGTIAGRNADAREASAREVLAGLYQAQVDAEAAARGHRLALDLAQLEVKRLHALMRLGELQVRSVDRVLWGSNGHREEG